MATYTEQLATFVAANPGATAAQFAEYLDKAVATRTADAGPRRPKAGTITGRVWGVCDDLAKAGPVVRKQVLEVCRTLGINDATTTTQYQLWKTAAKAAPAVAAPKFDKAAAVAEFMAAYQAA